MNDPSPRAVAATQAVMQEAAKVTAAMQMLEAANSELDAALTRNNWKAVEEAREKCVIRYECVLDAKIGAIKHLREQYPFPPA